jgi:hypothetical protein
VPSPGSFALNDQIAENAKTPMKSVITNIILFIFCGLLTNRHRASSNDRVTRPDPRDFQGNLDFAGNPILPGPTIRTKHLLSSPHERGFFIRTGYVKKRTHRVVDPGLSRKPELAKRLANSRANGVAHNTDLGCHYIEDQCTERIRAAWRKLILPIWMPFEYQFYRRNAQRSCQFKAAGFGPKSLWSHFFGRGEAFRSNRKR